MKSVTRKKTTSPAWMAKIAELKRLLGVDSQSAFAQTIGVAQQVVSKWERGIRPTAEMFALLGNMAPYPLALDFWEEAGISRSKMNATVESQQQERIAVPTSGEVVTLPLFLDGAESPDRPPRSVLIDARYVKHPASTIATELAVDSTFRRGDIVIIDTTSWPLPGPGAIPAMSRSVGGSYYVGHLIERMVAIYHSAEVSSSARAALAKKIEELTNAGAPDNLVRSLLSDLRDAERLSTLAEGLHIGWLRKKEEPMKAEGESAVLIDFELAISGREAIPFGEGFYAYKLVGGTHVTEYARVPRGIRIVGHVIGWIDSTSGQPAAKGL